MFSYLSKALFSDFLQFKGNFVDSRNNSKYRDVASLKSGLVPSFGLLRNLTQGRIQNFSKAVAGILLSTVWQMKKMMMTTMNLTNKVDKPTRTSFKTDVI